MTQSDLLPARTSTAPLLDIDALSVDYGHVSALRDISIRVGQGEAVALVGANGAGKTTLFKAIVGLLKVRAGTIRFQQRRLGTSRPEERIRMGLGYSPEGRRLFPGLTVRENLEVAVFGTSAERLKLVEMAFELFPVLEERQKTPGWQLSGGQQQMLAIARALMGRPSLLLLDEPSLGLSPKLADEVFRQMKRIIAGGTAVLLAEQNVSRALQYCDRAYVLEMGKIVLSGPSEQMRDTTEIKKAYLGG